MTYEANLEKNPIEIDLLLTKLDSTDQKKILCIAKLEDKNNMVLAMMFDAYSDRPTEFNDSNSIKLKRVE